MNCRHAAFAFVLGAASLAPAGTIRHDVADGSYTALAGNSNYDAVGALLWNEGANGFIASGTMLSSDWVLTAGHVVDGNNLAGGGITNLRFILGANAGQSAVNAAEWIPMPGWTGASEAGLDIGLVRLTTDIFSVTPAKRYIGTGEKTLTGTNVGYGLTGTGLTGTTANSAGVKRAGNNALDRYGNEVNIAYSANVIFSDFDRPGMTSESSMGANTPLALEYQIAGGDSGGPVFIDTGGDTLVAAVHSFLRWTDGTGNADYGDQAGSVRLNGVWQSTKIINDWISSVITVPGDADADFDVDLSDLSVLASSYGIGSGGHWHLGDFDLDGDVDLSDLSSLAANYGSGEAQAMADFQSIMSVPEPATASILAFTAILFRRRPRA